MYNINISKTRTEAKHNVEKENIKKIDNLEKFKEHLMPQKKRKRNENCIIWNGNTFRNILHIYYVCRRFIVSFVYCVNIRIKNTDVFRG